MDCSAIAESSTDLRLPLQAYIMESLIEYTRIVNDLDP